MRRRRRTVMTDPTLAGAGAGAGAGAVDIMAESFAASTEALAESNAA